jgi:D-alanine--poly(phosphoribitol) ligase subunit 2
VNLEKQIIALLSDLLQADVKDRNLDLVASGILDSMNLVELLVSLEKKFATRISFDDLDLDQFRTVSGIAGFISRNALCSDSTAA